MPTVILTGVHTAEATDSDMLSFLSDLRKGVEDLVYGSLDSADRLRIGFIPVANAMCAEWDEVQYLKIQVPDLYVGVDDSGLNQKSVDELAHKLALLVFSFCSLRYPNLRCVDCQVHPLPKDEQNDATRVLRIGHSVRFR